MKPIKLGHRQVLEAILVLEFLRRLKKMPARMTAQYRAVAEDLSRRIGARAALDNFREQEDQP